MKPKFSLILVGLLGFCFHTALCIDEIGITLASANDTVCIGEKIATFDYIVTGGPDALEVHFSDSAIFYGFENKSYTLSADTSGTIEIDVPETAVVDTFNAKLYVVEGGIYVDSLGIIITVLAQPYAGEDGTINVCNSINITDTLLFKALNGVPDKGGEWTRPSEGLSGTYIYTVTSFCGEVSSVVEVTEICITLASVNDTVCIGEKIATFDYIVTGGPDALEVHFSDSAIIYGFENKSYTLSADTSGTIEIDIPETAVVDTFNAKLYVVEGGIYVDSLGIIITILAQPYAGEDGTVNVCNAINIADTLLFKALKGVPDKGGKWTRPSEGLSGTYIYTVTSFCGEVSSVVEVTEICINLASANDTVCIGEKTATFDYIVTGGPDVLEVHFSDSAIIYGFENTNYALSADTSGTIEIDIPETAVVDTFNAKLYVVEGGIYVDSLGIIITILAQPYAGEDGTVNVCNAINIADTLLFKALKGVPDKGGKWTRPTEGLSGEYIYTVTSFCGEAHAVVSVYNQIQPNAGNDTTLSICVGESIPKMVFLEAFSGIHDTEGSWVPDIADSMQIGVGTYKYTISAIKPCTNSTATVTVEGIPLPEMETIVAKPAGEVSVLIFPDSVTIEQIVVITGSIIDTLELDEGGYLYIEPEYRVAKYKFRISFHRDDGCSNVVEYTYSELGTVSINEFTTRKLKGNEYSLFPNPAKNQITIELHPMLANTGNDLWARIFSLSGSCVLEAELRGTHLSISTDNLKPGIYFVQVSNSKVLFESKKLIISK